MNMTTAPAPSTLAEFAEAVRSFPRVLAVGAGTKPRLSQVAGDFTAISTRALSGIAIGMLETRINFLRRVLRTG